MNRKRSLQIRSKDLSLLTLEQLQEFMGLCINGDIEFYYGETSYGWVKGEVDFTALLSTGAFDVVANFPKLFELLSSASEKEGILTLDNTGKYCQITSVEELELSVLENIVTQIPQESTVVTEEFIDNLDTKTALEAWLTGRGLDEVLDFSVLKAQLFHDVKVYFGFIEEEPEEEEEV